MYEIILGRGPETPERLKNTGVVDLYGPNFD
jgi:hypothetical protein